jgi:hypothetical protein
MDTYTHIGLHDERAAPASLPGLLGSAENKAVVSKTGTNDMPVGVDVSAYKKLFLHK